MAALGTFTSRKFSVFVWPLGPNIAKKQERTEYQDFQVIPILYIIDWEYFIIKK